MSSMKEQGLSGDIMGKSTEINVNFIIFITFSLFKIYLKLSLERGDVNDHLLHDTSIFDDEEYWFFEK